MPMDGMSSILKSRPAAMTAYISTKKFYIPYPEYSLIVAVYAGEDVSEADAKKAVGSMTVNPSGKERKVKASMLWSNMTDSDSNESLRLTATFEEMKNLHSIGDTFTLPSHAYSSGGKWIRTSDVTAKVTDVSIMDSERDSQQYARERRVAFRIHTGRWSERKCDFIRPVRKRHILGQSDKKRKSRISLSHMLPSGLLTPAAMNSATSSWLRPYRAS